VLAQGGVLDGVPGHCPSVYERAPMSTVGDRVQPARGARCVLECQFEVVRGVVQRDMSGGGRSSHYAVSSSNQYPCFPHNSVHSSAPQHTS
jgi:hypothetical protein